MKQLTRFWLIPALMGAALLLGACAGTLPAGLKLPPELATGAAQAKTSNPVIELTGAVEAMTANNWTVGGKVVNISPATDIKGNFGLGDNVKVQAGITAEGMLEAEEIDAAEQSSGDQGKHLGQELEFKGTISAMAADSWTVDGKVVMITPDTKIQGTFIVGDLVKIHAFFDANGNLVARVITPVDELTETPEASETPEATEAPEETEAPEATEAPDVNKVEFTGAVEAMAADMWTIGGKQVAVNADTEIKGTIVVGDMVKVEAVAATDGSLTALEIKLADSGPHLEGGFGTSFGGSERSGSGGSGSSSEDSGGHSGRDGSGD